MNILTDPRPETLWHRTLKAVLPSYESLHTVAARHFCALCFNTQAKIPMVSTVSKVLSTSSRVSRSSPPATPYACKTTS